MPLVDGLLNERGDLVCSSQIWPETGILATYPKWSTRTTDATFGYHVASVIPLVAHLANRFGVRNFRDEPFRFQHCLIGKSGASKSSAWKRANRFYYALCQRLGMSPSPGPLLISGSLPGLFEALGDMREENSEWHYGILWHDEISSFLRNSRQEAVAEFLCMIADGERHERHLRSIKAQNRLAAGSALEVLENHAFQGLFVTTFDVVRLVTKPEYVNGGAFSRWAWFVGPDHPHHERTWNERLDEREKVIDAFADWVSWLQGEVFLYAKRGEQPIIEHDEDASIAAGDAIYQELCAETSDAMVCLQKRGLELVPQYASIFALSEYRLHATPPDYERAANLVAYSLDCYRRLLPRIGASGGNPTDVARSKIDDAFAAIVKAGDAGLSRSELHKCLSRPGKDVMDKILETLLDEDTIAEHVVKRVGDDGTATRGRPTRHYVALVKRRTV